MTSKFSISVLAALAATFLPAIAIGQVSSTSTAGPVEPAEHVYKYSVYGGFGYTSLNQVNQSRYGLEGFNIAVTRNFGRYFGVMGEGDYYKHPISTGNPGNPEIESVLFGPELHAVIYGKVGGFFHGLLGGEHTGGESMTPNISFAGGVGGGLEYNLNPRFAIRATGDVVGASFSFTNNNSQLANSPHMTWNSRAGIGVAYHF